MLPPSANPTYWLHMARRWAPSVAGYGAAGGLFVIYLTDNWFSKPVLKAVPWIGDRYQGGDE
eukprot:m.30947 g.30947  ORF g.30947 m.30947 type:complete len:62 (+) comp12019_c0_seq1:1935-2120(+)